MNEIIKIDNNLNLESASKFFEENLLKNDANEIRLFGSVRDSRIQRLKNKPNTLKAITADLRMVLDYLGFKNIWKLSFDDLNNMLLYYIVGFIKNNDFAGMLESFKNFYLHQLSLKKSRATLNRYKSSLSSFFVLNGLNNFNNHLVIKELFKADINNDKATLEKVNQKKAFNVKTFAERLQNINETTPKKLRDHALMSVAFICALRRSELTNICFEDIQNLPQGFKITLQKTKTGLGQVVYVPKKSFIHAYIHLDNWLNYLNLIGINDGYIFRGIKYSPKKGDSVRDTKITDRMIKEIMRLYIDDFDKISAHSLRISFITYMSKLGRTSSQIKQQTRHKTEKMILDYSRMSEDDIFGMIGDAFG